MNGDWTCPKCGREYTGLEVPYPAPDEAMGMIMSCAGCSTTDAFQVYWSQSAPQLRTSRQNVPGPVEFVPSFDRAFRALASVAGVERFVLERQSDGTWLFGAPSMLSYSPRPGDMAAGATATAAMREWIEAQGADGAP